MAGTLDDIEKNATDGGSKGSGKGSTSHGSDSDTGTSILGAILWDIGRAAFCSTANRARIFDNGYVPEYGRSPGDPDIPIARLDLGAMALSDRIRGFSGRVALGWGPVALKADRVVLAHDGEQGRSLSRASVVPSLRMSPVRSFELDAGIGVGFLEGKASHGGCTIALDASITPWSPISVRWIPNWSFFGGSVLYDQEASLWWSHRWISAFAGWRWIGSGNAATNGPQAGLSLAY